MAIFGFIVLVLVLVFFSACWLFMVTLDGAFGKRDIPIWIVIIGFAGFCFLWSIVFDYSPFTVTFN